ncbi:pirin family protein [Gordonia sp. CPCC 205515]|uniref:pirin family protein n=1 Tax=Gordonia sp. CPCC 205515 TaxID=3140791 RepID=UPI003AF3EA65
MTAGTVAQVRLIRAADRFHWHNEWLESWQSFPATGNFDLAANAHGMLLVHNDDRVDAGEGLDTHQHQDIEIITWVVDGALRHRDSRGHEGVLHPGVAQRMTAGTGIRHSEGNASSRRDGDPLRVVQMWVPPEHAGLEPGYAEADFTDGLRDGQLVVVASGRREHADSSAISIANPFVALYAARPRCDGRLTLPAAQFGHLFIVGGSVDVDGVGALDAGDALRLTDHGPLDLTATDDAEILYWEMHGGVRG